MTDAVPARPPGHCHSDESWAEFVRQNAGLERKQLCGGHLTDFEVAYQIAMTMRDDLDHEGKLLMAKDRIRWLSIRLAEALAGPWSKVEAIRQSEGAAVTILADNPDFEGPGAAIELCAEWTNWQTVRFTGDTVGEALATAVTGKGGTIIADPLDPPTFQDHVLPWLIECFGQEIAGDAVERCDRFVEEALELVQSLDWPKDRALALVEYVYGRPRGAPHQEAGGTMVTLAALCQAVGLDMHQAGHDELARIMQPDVVQKIRAKQAAKPTGSALPIAMRATPEVS